MCVCVCAVDPGPKEELQPECALSGRPSPAASQVLREHSSSQMSAQLLSLPQQQSECCHVQGVHYMEFLLGLAQVS